MKKPVVKKIFKVFGLSIAGIGFLGLNLIFVVCLGWKAVFLIVYFDVNLFLTIVYLTTWLQFEKKKNNSFRFSLKNIFSFGWQLFFELSFGLWLFLYFWFTDRLYRERKDFFSLTSPG